MFSLCVPVDNTVCVYVCVCAWVCLLLLMFRCRWEMKKPSIPSQGNSLDGAAVLFFTICSCLMFFFSFHLKHMSFCSVRNDWLFCLHWQTRPVRICMAPSMSYICTQKMRLHVCVYVCVCTSNREREPSRGKKSLSVNCLLGSFQKLLLMLATWHNLIRFALPFPSASNQL